MNKTAFVTGISGQDGSYLAKLLLEKGYHVVGGERRNASGNLWRLKKLGIEDSIEISDFELSEFTNIYRNIDKYKPDEFYNLAAQSFVASSFEMPERNLTTCRIRFPLATFSSPKSSTRRSIPCFAKRPSNI